MANGWMTKEQVVAAIRQAVKELGRALALESKVGKIRCNLKANRLTIDSTALIQERVGARFSLASTDVER